MSVQYILNKASEIEAMASKAWEIPYIEYSFDLKGTIAGQAIREYGENHIRFNMDIYKANADKYDQTIAHEIAHIIQFNHYPNSKGHDRVWKGIMRKLGYAPDRCHSYNLEGVQVRRQKKHIYKCGCTVHKVSTTRHNRIVKGIQTYHCRSCQQTIKKVG